MTEPTTEYTTAADTAPWTLPEPVQDWKLAFRGGDGWMLPGRWSGLLRWWWNRTIGRLTGLRWWESCPTLAEFNAAVEAMVADLRGFRDKGPLHMIVPPDAFDMAKEIAAEPFEQDLQTDVRALVEDLCDPKTDLILPLPRVRPKKAHTAITRSMCLGCGEVMGEDQIPRRVDGRVLHSQCYSCLDARWEGGALKATLRIQREGYPGGAPDIEEQVVHLVPPENLLEFVAANKIRYCDQAVFRQMIRELEDDIDRALVANAIRVMATPCPIHGSDGIYRADDGELHCDQCGGE